MSKKNIVVLVNRGVTSKYVKSLIEQMSILNEFKRDEYSLIFLTQYSTNKATDYIKEVADVEFQKTINYKEHYESNIFSKKYPTWLDYYNSDASDEIINQLDNVAAVFMFGGMLSAKTGWNRETNNINNQLYTQQQMNFRQNGILLTGCLLLTKIALRFDCQFNEICYDPCENAVDLITNLPDISDKLKYVNWHGYDKPEYNLQHFDLMQYYYNNKLTEVTLFNEPIVKEYDIVFGMTILTDKRYEQYQNLLKIDNIKTFVKNKFTGEDTYTTRDIYLDHIKRSNYTLIIPPYDMLTFSIYRFIESIYNDCLPLIMSDCYTEDFINSYDIDINIIREITREYETDLQLLTEKRRLELINYFKDKLFTNLNINVDYFLKETND